MTNWTIGKIYKFLNNNKTMVFIEILSKLPKTVNSPSRGFKSNKYWIDHQNKDYMIEFEKIFVSLSIEAEETTREDVFKELLK